jgi:hypothetical protein
MIRKFRQLVRGTRAQGMTEYIIIVALIAIAALTLYGLFGKQIRAVVATTISALGGTPSETTTDLKTGTTESGGDLSLKDFAKDKK